MGMNGEKKEKKKKMYGTDLKYRAFESTMR